jgi:hypothetical protein
MVASTYYTVQLKGLLRLKNVQIFHLFCTLYEPALNVFELLCFFAS